MRKNSFYFVKLYKSSDWTVGEFLHNPKTNATYFYLPGYEDMFNTSKYPEIKFGEEIKLPE